MASKVISKTHALLSITKSSTNALGLAISITAQQRLIRTIRNASGRQTSAMSTFILPSSSPPCEIKLCNDLTQEQLLNFPAFKTWSKTLLHSLSLQHKDASHTFHKSPYSLRTITIQSVDWFGSDPQKRRLGFLKFSSTVSNDDGEYLPGSVFLRGGSLAMLLILQPDDMSSSDPEQVVNQERYVLLTVQPRIAAGSLGFSEIPAGMLDDNGSFSGGAAKEIKEETGLEVTADDLIDLTQLAIQAYDGDEQLQKGVYPSAGGSDEFIPIFLHQRKMPRDELRELQGRLTGLRDHGEKITLKVVKLKDLWREGARDAKTLSALALYEGLKREGKI
ncbi:hypothetical protein K431DRAFT_288015 [Polychaeton citri CBS 116435]|uniref:Nudix hydrolase domain-containing protein n=1 Tax=Polychaeton citri CBS 116435 TaxID=1314669 RepID=A0A9P4ULQ3_9PEZI|nr:hypothetical protein K431DRAFT_288015 [Polychaeton citri CBS 116435]